MNPPLRIGPNHEQLQQLNGNWREIHGMPTLVEIPGSTANGTQLSIADVSCLPRFGVKGPGAAAWLESQGIAVSDRPNSWCSLTDGSPDSMSGIVARLGMTEFLVEDSLHSSVAPRLAEACRQPPAQVYPVLRQDLAIVLVGEAVNDVLLQTCSCNFRALSLAEHPVVLTSMVGITVTMIPGERHGQPFYRIWCDGTFGAYLWRTLWAIVQELGGRVVGVDQWINPP